MYFVLPDLSDCDFLVSIAIARFSIVTGSFSVSREITSSGVASFKTFSALIAQSVTSPSRDIVASIAFPPNAIASATDFA